MIICIDARIPLILVGKPGSSKSLAMQAPCDTAFMRSKRGALAPHQEMLPFKTFNHG